jgi:hypothetical protein
MQLFKKWKRSDWMWWGIVCLVASYFFGPYILEPTDAPKYFDVRVISYRSTLRGSEFFTVVSTTSAQSWEVGAARGPFSWTYRGPAVLSISRGHWTGEDHFSLLEGKTLVNHPNTVSGPSTH